MKRRSRACVIILAVTLLILACSWMLRCGLPDRAIFATQPSPAPVPTINLAGFTPAPQVLTTIPAHLAGSELALPLAEQDGLLVVALPEPVSGSSIKLLDWYMNRPFRPVMARRPELVAAITHHYGGEAVARMPGREADLPKEEKPEQIILIQDVTKYVSEQGVPIRRGMLPFTWKVPANATVKPLALVEADYQRSHNGFKLGYVLSATIDRCQRGKATVTESDLRDIRIRYRDDRLDASRLDANAVDGVIAELYQPANRIDWHGQGLIPGGELIEFTPPMKKLIILGPAAREPLHRLLDDGRVQDEVVLVLGAIGDETTVPLLINRYPQRLSQHDQCQKKMVCFSFALSYLTGQEIDRDRSGTTQSEDNAGLWRAWWAKAGPTFRLPAERPNASWVPIYPLLTEDWAVRVRDEFTKGSQRAR
jgi:Type II secretion system (T2SS), protein E, N-terminal domain